MQTIGRSGTETEDTRTASVIGSDFEKRLTAQTTLGRLGHPDDIARVAVFLASGDSSWISGGRFAVPGGLR